MKNNRFEKGDKVILVSKISVMAAKLGATATVRGYKIASYGGFKAKEYLLISWDHKNKLYSGQTDGGYSEFDFDLFLKNKTFKKTPFTRFSFTEKQNKSWLKIRAANLLHRIEQQKKPLVNLYIDIAAITTELESRIRNQK